MTFPAARDEMEARLLAAAEAANEKIRTCHERVACPRCGAPVGKRCTKLSSKSYRSADPGLGRIPAIETKHPHEERWTQEVPKR